MFLTQYFLKGVFAVNMCIYLGDNPSLTYVKQEHVFPAGLGGIQKLPKGVVSDQANELFSPLEDKLLHHSTLSFCRAMLGPGNRGKLGEKNASKSQVCVAQNDDGTLGLSYISLGKPYIITQAQFKGNTASLSCRWEGEMTDEAFDLIRSQLLGFGEKFTYIHSDLLDGDTMIIGFLDGIYYVANSGERPEASFVHDMIGKLRTPGEITEFRYRECQARQHLQLQENADTARVYAKTCMNVLAHLYGEDFARQSCFDEIRNWIVKGGSDERYSYPRSVVRDHPAMQKIVPEWAHWCCICEMDSHFYAIVCFYNRYIRKFDLGVLPAPMNANVNGFICDWQNRKEYTLLEYFGKICSAGHAPLPPV